MTDKGYAGFSIGRNRGEIAVQSILGVGGAGSGADRISNVISPSVIDIGNRVGFVLVSSIGKCGRPWTSIWQCSSLQLSSMRECLHFSADPHKEDPLAEIGSAQAESAALLFIDFVNLKRYRINGRIATLERGNYTVRSEQAFRNCKKYLRELDLSKFGRSGDVGKPEWGCRVSDFTGLAELIKSRCSGFFLGSMDSAGRFDVSYRGGEEGFMKLHEDTVNWDDFPGNNYLMTAGNLIEEPRSSMLLLDPSLGRLYHLSGTAQYHFGTPNTFSLEIESILSRFFRV